MGGTDGPRRWHYWWRHGDGIVAVHRVDAGGAMNKSAMVQVFFIVVALFMIGVCVVILCNLDAMPCLP